MCPTVNLLVNVHRHLNIFTVPPPDPAPTLGCGSPGRRSLGRSDVEDGADAQEEAPEDGPQLRDQVKLHHFTQVGVVAGSMGLELIIGQP